MEDPQKLVSQGDGCPDDESLAAFVDGNLTDSERVAIEGHLARCPRCYEIFAGVLRQSPASQSSGSRALVFRPRFGTGRRVTVALLAAALLAGICVSLFFRLRPSGTHAIESAIADLAQSVQSAQGTRRTAARLAGFPYGPEPRVTRSGSQERTETEEDYELRAHAPKILESFGGDPRPEARHAVGLVYLVDGQPGSLDKAIEALEEAARAEPPNARFLSDLSAAYLERERFTGSDSDRERALEAATRALRLAPELPEAAFNRALSLAALSRSGEAQEAWDAFLKLDGASEWAEEARGRKAGRY